MDQELAAASGEGTVSRTLGMFTTTSVVVANMIGTGILTTSGIIASHLPGVWWVLGCWLVGGIIAMTGALSYGELATRMPQSGGEYVYLKKLYHPILGFLTGWISLFVGFSAPIAASAIAFSEYFAAGLDLESVRQVLFLKKSVAAGIILIFTVIHYLGLRLGAIVQNTLTVIKLTIVVGLALTGIVLSGGSFPGIHLTMPSEGFALGTAMMLVMFSFSGWNASAYIAEEVRDPQRNLPRSLILGTGIVTLVYLAMNLFIFLVLPYEQVQGTIPVVEVATSSLFGEQAGNIFGLLVSIALLASVSALILLGPRVYYAMAKDRMFFSFASRVHPRYKVPGTAILLQGAIAILIAVLGSFEQLLIYIGYALGIFTWLAVASLFLARKRQVGEKNAVRTPGYPYVPGFFLLANLVLLVVTYVNNPVESTVAILTLAVGVPFYFLVRKKAGTAPD